MIHITFCSFSYSVSHSHSPKSRFLSLPYPTWTYLGCKARESPHFLPSVHTGLDMLAQHLLHQLNSRLFKFVPLSSCQSPLPLVLFLELLKSRSPTDSKETGLCGQSGIFYRAPQTSFAPPKPEDEGSRNFSSQSCARAGKGCLCGEGRR